MNTADFKIGMLEAFSANPYKTYFVPKVIKKTLRSQGIKLNKYKLNNALGVKNKRKRKTKKKKPAKKKKTTKKKK